MTPRIHRFINQLPALFWGLLVLTVLLPGCYQFFSTFSAVNAVPRVQLDNEEGALLYQTIRLSQAKSIYAMPQGTDCVPNVYPPVYFGLVVPLMNADAPTLAPGRYISFAAALLLLLLSGATLFRNMSLAQLPMVLLPTGLLMLTYEVPRWSSFFRVDMTAVALSAAGLIVLFHIVSREQRTKIRLCCALALFVLGFYTKQTMLAAPLAAILWLMADKTQRKTGLCFAGAFVGTVLLVFALLCVMTNGNFFRLTLMANTNTFVWNDVLLWMRHLWFFYKFWLLAAIVLSVLGAWFCRSKVLFPWGLYLVCTLPGVLAIGKLGSAENYLLEFLFALAVFTASTLTLLLNHPNMKVRLLTLIPGALLCAHLGTVTKILKTIAPPLTVPNIQGIATWNDIATQVRIENKKGNKTWCEPAALNVIAQAPVYYQPFIMSELTRQGKSSDKSFREMIERREFTMLVTLCEMNSAPDTTTYTNDIIDAIHANYKLSAKYGDDGSVGPLRRLFIYRPQ